MQPPSALTNAQLFEAIQQIHYPMRTRKASTSSKARARRSSTPATPSGRLEAKRQYMKKQRIRQQQQRKKDGQLSRDRRPRRSAILTLAAMKAKRERWAAIARETQGIVLGDGKYVEERRLPADLPAGAQFTGQQSGILAADSITSLRVVHDISAQIELSRQGTIFYPHYSQSLASWATRRPATTGASGTVIEFIPSTTLTVTHMLSRTFLDLHPPHLFGLSQTNLGVLSFASPKRPGGGYLHGGDEQEESIARLSSLVASLGVHAAREFYKEHKTFRVEDGSGLHDHSMVYSPGVVVFRTDWDDKLGADVRPSTSREASLADDTVGGDFIPPYTINVLSSVPVNAAAVRAKHSILPSEEQFFEDGIRQAMKERMARALRAFEEKRNKVIVLGAFGCGSSQNRVETVASIWAELLVCGDHEVTGESQEEVRMGEGGPSMRTEEGEGQWREARFKNVFERVVFAVPGKLFEPFKKAFDMRLFEEEVARAAMSPS